MHADLSADGAPWQRLMALLRHQPVEPLTTRGWRGGQAIGPLVVTNLTVATTLIGTPWFPPLAGAFWCWRTGAKSPTGWTGC
jgi:muramoyltetrapeptide carboxypeptidase